MGSTLADLRYAIRQLVARPGFALAAILSLALGLGANTTIFGVTNALLLREMAVPRPEEMVKVYVGDHSPLGLADLEYFRSHARTFRYLVAEDQSPATMLEGDTPERVIASVVTGDFWQALELKPQAGRFFARQRNDAATDAPVVVLSDAFWRRRFAADPSIVGRKLHIGRTPVEVTGIAPPGFGSSIYGFGTDLYLPLSDAEPVLGVSAASFSGGLYATGRLHSGVQREQADAEMRLLMEQLRKEQPDGHQRMTVRVDHARGLTAEVRAPVAIASGFLSVITGLVLLIACANVGNLLLARNAARRRELGVRLALGAERSRLVRQLLTENLLLALAAGGAGLVAAAWMGRVLVGLMPAEAHTLLSLPVDGRVALYGVSVSLIALLAFGLAPALRATRDDVFSALRDDSRAVAGGRSRLRKGFLLAQVGLSTVLLAIALLFARSLQHAQHIDAGYDASNLVSVGIDLRLGRYDAKTGTQFFDRVVNEMRSLSIVRGAALAATVPLSGSRMEMAYVREGEAPLPDNTPRPTTDFNVVGPGYFATTGIALLRGRDFTPLDDSGSTRVIVVNRAMAERLTPGADVIGKRISFENSRGPWFEVVGVARDIKYNTLGESSTPMVYVPLPQQYRRSMMVQVRLAPGTTLNVARKALMSIVATVDPGLPPADIQTVASQQQLSLLPSKIGAGILGVFGTLALVLASVGIFGVAAFAVAQRTREIGIRSALGARPAALLGAVLGDTLRTVATGCVIGVALALGAAQLLRSQLYGVGAVEPVTFVLVPIVLTVVAVVATAIPARRAVRVDPVVALRSE
jgi:putative ABC transport system permease protein